MPFETLNPRLRVVAQASYSFCRNRFGQTGAKCDEQIDNDIGWRPTFQMKSGVKLIAVEVEDNLYPEILKIAAHDIGHSKKPIAVYQACSLEAYLLDNKQVRIMQLKKHGFGIITVDDQSNVTIQHKAVPLAQHISEDKFEGELKGLTPKMKVAFREAYSTYVTDPGQGLQAAGQIIEAMVLSLANSAKKKGLAINPANAVARVIDDIYANPAFSQYRGAGLGGTRDFVREYRNIASHPANSATNAVTKMRKCQVGFLQAIGLARKLRIIGQRESLPIPIHTE